MRVLTIGWAVSDHRGGGEPVGMYELVRHLALEGVDVDVVTPDLDVHRPLPGNVRAHVVRGGPRPGNTGANKWAMLREVRRLHRRESFDVTHVMTQFTSFPVEWHPFVISGSWQFPPDAGAAKPRSGLSLLVEKLGSGPLAARADAAGDVAYALAQEHWRGWNLDRTLREADLVLVRQSLGVGPLSERARRVEHLPLATDPDVFPFSDAPRPPVVFTAAALKPYKNVGALVRAFARAAASRPEATLRIAGEGPERGALEALARELGVADRVTFLGRLPRPALVDEYAGAAVFALPSWEAFGQVYLEAMATGTPVVTSTRNAGAQDFMEDGVNGWIVPPTDVDALADAVGRALDMDAKARTGVARAARDTAERFSWREMARRLVALYETL